MSSTKKENAKLKIGLLDLPLTIDDSVKEALIAIVDAIPDNSDDYECLCENCKMFAPKKRRKII